MSYFAVAFAVSWGALLTVVGPGGFIGTTEPTSAQLPFVSLAMFAGPSVAAMLLTGLVEGRAGFRDLRSRLFTWRVAARWYVVAVLAAPILMTCCRDALGRSR